MIVEFPEGAKVLFGGRRPSTGLSEVGVGEDIARVAGERFKAAIASLAPLITALEQSIAKIAKRPDKVEMEFGASLSGDCNLWVVSGEGEAEFKIKLVWGSSVE
jgi:hypothetical protein